MRRAAPVACPLPGPRLAPFPVSDECRWRAAELIAAELATGKTQRQLAEEIGKTHQHAGYMNRVWTRFGNLGCQDRPPFNEAYRQAKLAEADADQERRRSAISFQGP